MNTPLDILVTILVVLAIIAAIIFIVRR